MKKPRRNDPCYCGSGKKYKQCHLKIDQAAEQEKREREKAAEFLRQDLIEYAQDDRFTTAVAKALPFYWDNYYDISNAEEMSDYEASRFFDWLMFDYDLPPDALEDDEDSEVGQGTRLLDLYYAEEYEDLSAHQQAMLDTWMSAGASGGYELLSYEGQMLQLRDYVSGETYEVYEPTGHGQVDIGEIVLARLIPVADRLEFSTGAAFLPKDEIQNIGDKLAAAREADSEKYPDADYVAFMRRHAHLYVHHALAQAKKVGRPPVDRLDPDREKLMQQAARQIKRRFR